MKGTLAQGGSVAEVAVEDVIADTIEDADKDGIDYQEELSKARAESDSSSYL